MLEVVAMEEGKKKNDVSRVAEKRIRKKEEAESFCSDTKKTQNDLNNSIVYLIYNLTSI